MTDPPELRPPADLGVPVPETGCWWVRIVPVVPLVPNLVREGPGSKAHPQPLIRWREVGPLRTEVQVREFWGKNPKAQLAIVLGPTTDGRFLGAIDTDLKNHKDGMPEPPVGFPGDYRHSTKSGGTHDLFFYKMAPPDSVTRRAIGVGGFVDVLLDGLLVVPPTKFDGGGEYRVARAGPIPEFEAPGLALDAASPWLKEAWKKHRSKAGAVGRLDEGDPILEGSRRMTLLSQAGKLRDLGVGADTILTDLRDINGRRCHPPLSDAEVETLVRDVVRRYEPTHEPRAGRFDLGPGRAIDWTPDLVSYVFINHDKKTGTTTENPVQVIPGYFRPRRKMLVEGETYYTVDFADGVPRTGTFQEIFDRLERVEGRVLARSLGRDVVAQLLYRFCKETETGWPTYGFYPVADGKLVEARAPTPVKDEQQRVAEEVSEAIAYAPKQGDLAAYATFASFYEPWEIFPLLGLSAISPFALTLRRKKYLIPHVLLWSQERNLGKSTAAFAVSDKAFGREHLSASALNSEFRFPANVDACCGPLAVEEAERFGWDSWGGELKTAAESPLITKRGRTSLAQVSYLSRTVLLFSANTAGIVSGPSLARFFVLHFAENQALPRRTRRRAFEEAFAALKPVGPAVAREIGGAYPTVVALLEAVDSTADALDAECVTQGVELRDPRRSRSWAATWLGLRAWRSLAEEEGESFPIPDLPTFVRVVVARVEAETFESETTPLAAFRSWFENYKVAAITRTFNLSSYRDRRTGEEVGAMRPTEIDSLKGEGRTFEEGAIELPSLKGEKVPGDWIAKALLDLCNRQQPRPDLRFTDLKDLNLSAFREAGLPESDALEDDGKVHRHDFPHAGRQRAAFIPKESWSADRAAKRVRGSGGGSTRPTTLDNPSGPTRVPWGPVGSGVPDPERASRPTRDPVGSGLSTDGGTPLPDPRTEVSAYAREETTEHGRRSK